MIKFWNMNKKKRLNTYLNQINQITKLNNRKDQTYLKVINLKPILKVT